MGVRIPPLAKKKSGAGASDFRLLYSVSVFLLVYLKFQNIPRLTIESPANLL